ncbi:MAG: hypothetical protein ACQESR_26320, partial [Planctomycetota bacterium]
DADGLPVAWTVLVHVVAVEGYEVEEQAWGETTWDAPEDSGVDTNGNYWSLLWACDDHRWKAKTTSDGLMTAVNWGFESITLDSSRDRWTYASPGGLGETLITPTVTFGGNNIYFQTLNTASVQLHREGSPPYDYTADQPRIALTYVDSMKWEEVLYSRTVNGLDLAQLSTGAEGYVVYPDMTAPDVFDTIRVKVTLAEEVPKGMQGTLHLAWFDPDNTVANVPATPDPDRGPGQRDNEAALTPETLTLTFLPDDPTNPDDTPGIGKGVFEIQNARYGDNFIVAAHPHDGIVQTFEFRDDGSGTLVLMRPENSGEWVELPDNSAGDFRFTGDYRTSILTIFPSVDIDTDSDNTGSIEHGDHEDYVEDKPSEPGKIFFVNNDDDDLDGICDLFDGSIACPDDDLYPATLELAFPNTDGMTGFTLELTCSNHLYMYADDQKTLLPESASVVRGVHYQWVIGTSLPAFPPRAYVEGIYPGRGTVTWSILDTNDEVVYSDVVVFTVTGADLDVDSDNNGVLERNEAEEVVENAPAAPGKIVRARLGDNSDFDPANVFGDRVPDYADGYDRDRVAGNHDDIDLAAPAFDPLVLEVLDNIDLSVATIKFDYAASDPLGATESGGAYSPAAGNLRIWTKQANVARDGASVASGGDFVAPGNDYTTTQLGLSDTHRTVEFGLEGINPGVTTVKVLIDPDGPGTTFNYVEMDSVKVTVVYVDLDVNNNGALFDAVDGVANYLPGYEGTTNRLSTGTTFNNVSYVGQHMKIIAEGIGSGQGIDNVSLLLSSCTSLDGFAENKTAYLVQNDGSLARDDDYSFSLTLDDVSTSGTMTSGKTLADFYCKDYGGAATVVVCFYQGGNEVFRWTLDVPTDADNDGIADCWEVAQLAEFNAKYHTSHASLANAGMGAADYYDSEHADWDGLGPGTDTHKTAGDSLNEFQEYRGFLLDGGNGHPGGHKRLSIAEKELLVEVDVMEGLNWTLSHGGASYPYSFGETEARSIMEDVSGAFGHSSNGLGIQLYYVVDEPAASQDSLSILNDYYAWQDAHRHKTNGAANMLAEFVHFGFVDQYDWNATNGGYAGAGGATAAVKTKAERAIQEDGNLNDIDAWIVRTVAHEITHLLIDTRDANGFDTYEHLASPSLDSFVMSNFGPLNWKSTTFSDLTRRQVDLTHKQSVEETP